MTDDDSNGANIKPQSLSESRAMANSKAFNYQRKIAAFLRKTVKEATPFRFKNGQRARSPAPTKIVSISKNAPLVSQNIYSESFSDNQAYTTGEQVSLSPIDSTAYKMPTLYNSHPSEHQFILDS